MDEFDAAAEDVVVLPDGSEFVRVWHGALVHPRTGVKGGLMEYPAAAEPTEPEALRPPEPPQATGDVLRVCPVCRRQQRLPAWQARRSRTCSRRCAMLARNRGPG